MRGATVPTMTTRHAAILYLPTVGLWSLVRAVQFHRCRADIDR